MGSVDPFRINVDEERHAFALAQDLIGVSENGTGRPSPAYAIRRERSDQDIFVVSLAGEHDLYTAPKVQEELRSVIAAGARAIVVDLTKTTFFDSTMLHVLLSVRNELRDGRRLLLVTNDATERVFEIAGIDRFFDFYPSRRAAEQEVRSS
jgi:anti-sigma B factor antagonist